MKREEKELTETELRKMKNTKMKAEIRCFNLLDIKIVFNKTA